MDSQRAEHSDHLEKLIQVESCAHTGLRFIARQEGGGQGDRGWVPIDAATVQSAGVAK